MNGFPLRLPLPRCHGTIIVSRLIGNLDTTHRRRWFAVLLAFTVTASTVVAGCGGTLHSGIVVGAIERCQIREVLSDGVHWVAAADKICASTTAISVEYDLTVQKSDGTTYAAVVNFPVTVGTQWPQQ